MEFAENTSHCQLSMPMPNIIALGQPHKSLIAIANLKPTTMLRGKGCSQ
jgi:hypothetical protein